METVKEEVKPFMKPWFQLVNKVIRDKLQIVHMWHDKEETYNFYTTIESYDHETDKAVATCFTACGEHHHPEKWDLKITENALTDGEYLVRSKIGETPVLCRPTEEDDRLDTELLGV
jgi:hypothetical protein